jgi:hypothetical protein
MRLVLRDLQTIAGYALREAVRRKVLVVVVVLTICFLALYAFGTYQAFQEVAVSDGGGISGLEEEVLTGSTLLGLAMCCCSRASSRRPPSAWSTCRSSTGRRSR